MNIYCITWVQDNAYGLSSVVIAKEEKEALTELNLDESYRDEIKIKKIGNYTGDAKNAQIICQESL